MAQIELTITDKDTQEYITYAFDKMPTFDTINHSLCDILAAIQDLDLYNHNVHGSVLIYSMTFGKLKNEKMP